MDFIVPEKSELEVKQMSPLVWAYIGDSVYEQYIRTYLINTTTLKTHKLHMAAIQFVKAKAQAEIVKELNAILTEEERDIVRRGRNAENHHLPKNADLVEYSYSTAFEALIGYLYLTRQETRLKEILEKCIEIKKNETEGKEK